MAELAIRTVFSLAVVLGLLLVLTRVAGRRYRGGSGAVRVVQRQALSRGSAVTVVEIGRRTLVLGVTEQQVQVLAELEPGELESVGADPGRTSTSALPARPKLLTALRPTPAVAAHDHFAEHLLVELDRTSPEGPGRPDGRHSARHKAPTDRTPPAGGALAGSLLSPQTWKQGWQVIGRRAS
ncbi:flagellar biosynthetic protein FliO [Nocardioides rubriscoriae]|uniref:flagellar biosynthetic protein FliO n=1 Tax=Nocardioides rubriscoriae TaxID=642762 RepID=UPI0011DF70C3|nr:flagellar biosynthetic protein FliO [Nocardioides rubriscoriae]